MLRKKDILYAFSDVVYRNLFSAGDKYGGISGGYYNFVQTSNGPGANLGLGCKIPVCKSIILSPELFHSILAESIQGSSSPSPYGNAYKYSQTNDMVMA